MKRILFCCLLLSLSVVADAANTITLTSNLVSGNGSVTPTLTWSTSPAATSCTASGGWTGTRAASGTALLPTITNSTTYVLSCSWNDGQAVLTWTAPTKNTNGSNLTDLAGYKIYRQSGPSGTFGLIMTINDKAILTFTDTPLTPGAYGWQMSAFNSGGIESVRTATATKTVTASSDMQQIAINVNPVPETVGGFGVQ